MKLTQNYKNILKAFNIKVCKRLVKSIDIKNIMKTRPAEQEWHLGKDNTWLSITLVPTDLVETKGFNVI